jgi:hypothetical protein
MAVEDDPFAALGLPARAGLTDDDVRAAWRRVAAATHPDREDGGDPARFGAAAAAYAMLRTSFGRGEALADLGADGNQHRAPRQARRGIHRASIHRASAAARGDCGWRSGDWRSSVWPNGAAGTGARRVRTVAAARPGARAAAGRGLTVRMTGAAVLAAAVLAVAAAAVAAVGLTPATVGLLTGALTVTGWALWRRGRWGR